MEGVLAGADGALRRLVSRVREALEDAPVLGSLLKVEKRFRSCREILDRVVHIEGSMFKHEVEPHSAPPRSSCLTLCRKWRIPSAPPRPNAVRRRGDDALGFVMHCGRNTMPC